MSARSGTTGVLLGAALVVGVVAAPTASAVVSPRPAVQADTVADSVGVNTHLSYVDTNYGKYDEVVRPRLLELGVRHVRDVAYTGPADGADSPHYRKVRELGAKGLRFTLLTGLDTQHSRQTDYRRLADVRTWTGGALEAFEGPNEPDLVAGPDWVVRTREAQRLLADTVRSDARLAGVKVLGPSVSGAGAAAELGDLSRHTDVGNVHHYFGGRQPEVGGWGDDGYGSTDWVLRRLARPLTGSQSVWSTETGYVSDPAVDQGVPADIVAAYLPRAVLGHLEGGLSRTYVYELLDQDSSPDGADSHLGLVRGDGTPKPAFHAMRDLVGLFSDPGPSFQPRDLAYDVTGETDGVRSKLFQRRDGEHLLALWTDRPSWDVDRKVRLPVATRRVTVGLASAPAAVSAVRFDGTGPASSTVLPARGDVPVTVGPHLTVLRLTPAARSVGGPITAGDRCLEATGTSPGAAVVAAPCTGAGNQVFRHDGTVVHAPGGLCLDVDRGSTDDGARVQVWTCNGTGAQSWRADAGRLITAWEKCLDVDAASRESAARVIVYRCTGAANQQFTVAPAV